MNPAWSVILFTTTAGAGQGLVAVLAGGVLAGAAWPVHVTAVALPVALALLLVGLVASFFHLGRPERAWRAATMWRTSWLSREVIVLPAFIASVAGWWGASIGLLGPGAEAAQRAWALACLLLAVATWVCTGMIYACLRFVQEWAHPLTVAGFVAIGIATGAVLAGVLAVAAGEPMLARSLAPWALALVLAAWAVRAASWRRNRALKPRSTLQSATGIRASHLRQVSMGMTGGAFNTREFFHRATAAALPRIRLAAEGALFVLPAVLLGAAVSTGAAWPWWAALVCTVPGLVAERWLFFAQARHPQNLYYQAVS